MIFSINLFDDKVSSTKGREAMYSRIAEVDNFVNQNYVDGIDDEAVMNGMLKGYVNGIGDKYARYYSVEEWNQVQDSFNGSVSGIGISGKADVSGYIRVTKVYDNAPAKEAGLKLDDLIISVEDQDVLTIGTAAAMSLIQGEPGTEVKVTYLRDKAETTVKIVRKSINIPSLEYEVVGDVGYLKITEFNKNTSSLFDYAMKVLEEKGVKSLVIDLRDNSGGLTAETADILNKLLPEGVILSARYKGDEEKVLYTSDKDFNTLPVTIVVNENTASAAEMFAISMQDFGRAQLVGTTTYGKGVMQSYKQLSDGSGIDVTVAYLISPNGTEFNEVGVKPNFEVELTVQQKQTSHMLTFDTDPQLKKAFEVSRAQASGQSFQQGGDADTDGDENKETPEGEGNTTQEQDAAKLWQAAYGPRKVFHM